MKLNRYLKHSERTLKEFPEGMILDRRQADVLHAAMGISTESGELLDAVKKHLIYDEELDLPNVKEELGDLMWYIAILLRELGGDGVLEEVMRVNIEKLKARYPEKFTEYHAMNRAPPVHSPD
jgi:NTP pyrophosphatase (non-canonical NTP hydrolase)